MVIKARFDPRNSEVVEEIIKNKNVDIASLGKKLNLPTTEDPQAEELGETEI